MRAGFDNGSGKLIKDLRSPQKIEWRLHLDLSFCTAEIPIFGQKEVRQSLQESGSEKTRKQ